MNAVSIINDTNNKISYFNGFADYLKNDLGNKTKAISWVSPLFIILLNNASKRRRSRGRRLRMEEGNVNEQILKKGLCVKIESIKIVKNDTFFMLQRLFVFHIIPLGHKTNYSRFLFSLHFMSIFWGCDADFFYPFPNHSACAQILTLQNRPDHARQHQPMSLQKALKRESSVDVFASVSARQVHAFIFTRCLSSCSKLTRQSNTF